MLNNSQEITKDIITGALDASVTIDNRLLLGFMNAGKEVVKDKDGKPIQKGVDKDGNPIYETRDINGFQSIGNDFRNLGRNTKQSVIGASKEADRIIEGTYKISEKVGEAVGGDTGKTIFSNVLKYTIGSTIGGAISAFGEDGRTKDNYVVNNKVYDTWDEAIKDNPNIDTYNMGGVGTDLAGALKVSNDHPDSINRVNASDGLIGDTIEAGISALLGLSSFTLIYLSTSKTSNLNIALFALSK